MDSRWSASRVRLGASRVRPGAAQRRNRDAGKSPDSEGRMVYQGSKERREYEGRNGVVRGDTGLRRADGVIPASHRIPKGRWCNKAVGSARNPKGGTAWYDPLFVKADGNTGVPKGTMGRAEANE